MIKKPTDIIQSLPAYLPVILLCFYFSILSIYKPIGDFGNYYYGSYFLRLSQWGSWIYDAARFNLRIYELGQRDFFLNYTPVPPFSGVLYLPFTLLTTIEAKLCWNLLNTVLLVFVIFRLQQNFSLNPWFIAAIPILFYLPIRNNLLEGQSYFLLLFLLAEGLTQYQKGKLICAAFLWSISIHLKISPLFIFFFLALEKDFRSVLYLFAGLVLILIFSFLFIPLEIWNNYLTHILPRLFNGEINNTYAINYQSAQVLFKNLFVPDAMHNFGALFSSTFLYHLFWLLFRVVFIGFAILFSFGNVKVEHKFGIWIIVSLLISGYGNSFGMLLLLLPLFYFKQHWQGIKPVSFIFLLSLIVAIDVPLNYLHFNTIFLNFPRLYALIFIFFFFLISLQFRFKAKYSFIFLLLFIVIPSKDYSYEQNYIFDNEKALLIYDFTISGNQIKYNYFNGNGPQVGFFELPFKVNRSMLIDSLEIIQQSGSRKLRYLVNDSLIIYLSDQNRGVGFYTLRKSILK